MDGLAVHWHDTQAAGMAHYTAATQAGGRIHDLSIGGLAGYPVTSGAAGNMPQTTSSFWPTSEVWVPASSLSP
jgi:hypothetical protein